MAKGQKPVFPVNIPISTQIGSKVGGAPTPKRDPIGFNPQPDGKGSSNQDTSASHRRSEEIQEDVSINPALAGQVSLCACACVNMPPAGVVYVDCRAPLFDYPKVDLTPGVVHVLQKENPWI